MKIKGLRWWIIILIFIATVINYIDRTAFALLWPEMGKDLGMKNSDYATMFNWFLGAYAVGKFVSGKLYDKIGTRLGFTVSIIVWSVASVFHAFARGIVSLSVFRVLLGLGEAGNWPGAVKSNAEWFPIKERAIAQGIFNAGASIGNVIAPFIIVLLFTQFGWKTTYVILGVVGVLWVIPWLFLNKSTPEKHPWVTQEERDLINSDKIEKVKTEDNKKEKSLSLSQILSHKESWGVLLCRFFIEPVWWFFAAWMPIYLNSQFGLGIKEIAGSMWISYLFAAVGSIAGGWFSGKLIKSKSVGFSRKTTIALGGLLVFIGFIFIIMFVGKNSTTLKVTEVFGQKISAQKIVTIGNDTIRLNENGALKYTPDSLFVGKKVIPFIITDDLDSSTKSSSLEVVVTPVSPEDTKVGEEEVVTVDLNPLGDNANNLTIASINNNEFKKGEVIKLNNGKLIVTSQNTLKYTPKHGFSGKETIAYSTVDSKGKVTNMKTKVFVTPNRELDDNKIKNKSLTISALGNDDFMLFIYLAGLILFGFQFAIGNIQTLSSDLFRGPSVGTLAGLAGTVAAVSPMIMNWFVGQITSGGSYTPSFIAISISVILGVVVVFMLIKNVGLVRKTVN